MYLLKEFKKFWHILEAWCHASSYVIDRSYNWFGANDRLLVKSIWNCCFWPCVGCPRLANVYLVPRRKVPISYVHRVVGTWYILYCQHHHILSSTFSPEVMSEDAFAVTCTFSVSGNNLGVKSSPPRICLRSYFKSIFSLLLSKEN